MDDDIFEVGRSVSVETEFKYYLSTHIIGWERDAYLVMGIVHSSGKGGPLKVNEHCTMRFLKDGIAYGFETKIISINLHPFPVMFVQYPKTVERLTIRKFNRIKSNFQAHLLDVNGTYITDATITNISPGGCGLNIPVQEGREISSKHHYQIAFSILETDLRLNCAIRKMRNVKETCCLGIEFSNVSKAEREKINLLVDICTNILTYKTDLILSKLKTTGEALGGHIEDMPLSDILQIFDQLQKEGILYITLGQRKGFITLCNGRIMDASLDHMHGEDALVEFLSLKEGGFQFFAKEITSGHIKRPISFVLMDTCRLIDERDSLRESCPQENDALIFVKAPDVEDPEMQAVIDAFRNGASSLRDVNAATSLSLIRSTLAAAKLLKDGYLIKVV